MKRLFIIVLILVLVVPGVFYLFLMPGKRPINLSFVQAPNQKAIPTPFPFQELTISYLGSREYNSSLENIEKISENTNYTSFLASYNSDGLKINGLLTKPKGEDPDGGFPAIVFVHEYIPPSQYKTAVNYTSYVDYLASNGFVVFKIDLRGHDSSEGEPRGAYYSSDYIIDTLNAYSALQNSDFVNPDKVGLWGHSMAGNVVSRALGAKPSIPAIAIWAGAVYTYEDFSQFGIQDDSYHPPSEQSESRRRRNELFEKYGQFSPKSDFWKQVPMTNFLSEIKGAIQLSHAVDDNIVDIGYSRNFISILDKTTIAHELNEYSSGGHNLSGAIFSQVMEKTVAFFKKYLK